MEADQYLRDEGRKREIIPLASLLLPAIQAAKTAEARTERTIALLRTLEALRMYAAGHEGRLPSKLEDVTAVPIPIDPMTGKSFVYKCDGNTAVLEAPVARQTRARQSVMRSRSSDGSSHHGRYRSSTLRGYEARWSAERRVRVLTSVQPLAIHKERP